MGEKWADHSETWSHFLGGNFSAKTELGDGLMQVPKAGTNVIVIRISIAKTRSRINMIQ